MILEKEQVPPAPCEWYHRQASEAGPAPNRKAGLKSGATQESRGPDICQLDRARTGRQTSPRYHHILNTTTPL